MQSTTAEAAGDRRASNRARPAAAQGHASGTALETLAEKRRLLLLVRTGLTLALGYLLIFSSSSLAPPPGQIAFIVCYLASNLVIGLLPIRVYARAGFDVGLILTDTVAISAALLLIPDARNDMLVFYFTIMLLASIADRAMLTIVTPIITSGAYLGFLLARDGLHGILQPAILLRLPFFVLAGTFYGFFVDRVQRGQASVAAAQQRVEARAELLVMITHDLKQPLWIASQSAAMLYEDLGQASASSRELAAEVIVSLRRMESLTLNFLDLSRMESSAVRLSPRRIPLNRLIDDLVHAYRPALDLKGIHACVELAPTLPSAWIDPVAAERCLANLIDNAVKYTPTGGTITCRTAADGEWVSVTIGDSGPGIKPAHYATLFTRFQPGDAASGRDSTGLGLYIAHALAQSLAGDITLDRDHPQGAWFHIRFPVARDDGQERAAVSAVAPPLRRPVLREA